MVKAESRIDAAGGTFEDLSPSDLRWKRLLAERGREP